MKREAASLAGRLEVLGFYNVDEAVDVVPCIRVSFPSWYLELLSDSLAGDAPWL